jgi:hypothetical protein
MSKGGKCFLPNQKPIKIHTINKEECLEPEHKEAEIVATTKQVNGNGLNELQQKISNLNFIDDTPVKPIIKGERKKRNISFVF